MCDLAGVEDYNRPVDKEEQNAIKSLSIGQVYVLGSKLVQSSGAAKVEWVRV